MRPPKSGSLGEAHAHPPAKATNWPVVKRLVPSTNGAEKWASSSSVPRRPIGTIASTRARPSGVFDPVGLEELGEVHEVRADRVDLHALGDHLRCDVAHEHVRPGASRGVQRRARRWASARGAREHEHLSGALLDHHGYDGAKEVVRRLDAADEGGAQVVDGGAQEAPDDDAAGERSGRVDPPEAGERGLHQPLRRLRLRQVATPFDHLDRGAEPAKLVDEPVGGIPDDEVVTPLRQQPAELWPDVAGGVAHDRDAPAHPTRSRRAVNSGP